MIGARYDRVLEANINRKARYDRVLEGDGQADRQI